MEKNRRFVRTHKISVREIVLLWKVLRHLRNNFYCQLIIDIYYCVVVTSSIQ